MGLVPLLCLPFLWSLPTDLMIGELASALPAEGGFYVWVRCALGPFWGFQEAWLSLAASIFDMAIYPTLFTLYLGRLAPSLTAGHRTVRWSLACSPQSSWRAMGCDHALRCAGWALTVNLTFERLISIDLVLYGGSLILEFVALVVSR